MTTAAPTVPPGSQVSYTLVVTNNGPNAASATSASRDPNPSNNFSRTKAKITPVLRLHKVGSPTVVHAGGNVTYRLRVTDPTWIAIHKVTVCDTIPNGLLYVSSSPRAHLQTGRYCWSIPPLCAHSSRSYTGITDAAPGNGGKLVNHATASAPGIPTARAKATVPVIHAPRVLCGIASAADASTRLGTSLRRRRRANS
jgi:uncharacterized repeat protein (TIGR01451 family)